MKLLATINGQPAEIEIDAAQLNKGALTKTEAAIYLGCSEQTIWKLHGMGQIVKTSYGTYPISSLNDHLEAERNRK